MKAICVTASRGLEVREVSTPEHAATGHVLVDMDASAINHGDRTFLKLPTAAGPALTTGRDPVWGASGSGTVVATGAGVSTRYHGKKVAIYRSLGRTPESVGLWSQRAHVPYTACLVLPDGARLRAYCGSLVNVITAYAFLEEIAAAGHQGVVVTAGNSATGGALAALAHTRKLPVIFLARTAMAREAMIRSGAQHVIVTQGHFEDSLGALAAELETTAVFDGIGGELLGRVVPVLPSNSTVYIYGFLGGNAPIAVPSVLFMMKNLILRRFSNFESPTVKNQQTLVAALQALEGVIDDPMFQTKIGKEFTFDEIGSAMDYESSDGRKAVLVA